MALAVWGLRPGEYHPQDIEALATSWVRRKKLEARIMFGELVGKQRKTRADEMWEMMERYGGQTS